MHQRGQPWLQQASLFEQHFILFVFIGPQMAQYGGRLCMVNWFVVTKFAEQNLATLLNQKRVGVLQYSIVWSRHCAERLNEGPINTDMDHVRKVVYLFK